jgi:hypothetical protein
MTNEEKELLKDAFRLIVALGLSDAWQDCDKECDAWLVRFAEMFKTGIEPGKKDEPS